MANILENGPLRKFLRGRGRRNSPEVPTIARLEMATLITDEEKAWVEYSQLAKEPVFTPDMQASLILISEDEKRHAETLKNLLRRLELEGKLV